MGCQLPPGQGANIDGLVIVVSGTSVSLPALGARTIFYEPEDRDDDCLPDDCLEAWMSMWRAEFEVKRVPCAAECCRCISYVVNYPFRGPEPEPFGATYWESEEEANDAADEVIGFVESMAQIMKNNGYCNATVAIKEPRVVPFFAVFLDPPRVVWELAQPDFATINAGCCGETNGELISQTFPGTNMRIFGNQRACVQSEDDAFRICAPCSGCQCDPCCTSTPAAANPLP
jgi:hypothetical protein